MASENENGGDHHSLHNSNNSTANISDEEDVYSDIKLEKIKPLEAEPAMEKVWVRGVAVSCDAWWS